jgi:hypothetical protein
MLVGNHLSGIADAFLSQAEVEAAQKPRQV